MRKKQKNKISCILIFLFILILCSLLTGIFWCISNLQNSNVPFQIKSSSTVSSFTQSNEAEENWALILVNRDHPLPEDYSFELIRLDNGEQVDKRIFPMLQKMFDDMRADGVYPIVASGYRTKEAQQQILEDKINEYESEGYSAYEAKEKAEIWVALPDTSEHQLGLAVDINADGVHSTGDEVYQWLLKNSYRYGFVKRYPEDKTEITGIINEPWHYRYVGIEAAEQMTKQNLCLEEYLEMYQ